MEKAYTVEEIHTIEKKEFKRLKSSYTLMNRAGTNCAKKISKLDLKKKEMQILMKLKKISI